MAFPGKRTGNSRSLQADTLELGAPRSEIFQVLPLPGPKLPGQRIFLTVLLLMVAAFPPASSYLIYKFSTSWDYGQCTYWANLKRPDVARKIYAHYWDRPSLLNFLSAKNWATMAAASGLAVGTTPAAGALVVFQPGVAGAAKPYGHVAYVTKVIGQVAFEVSQMDAPTPGKVTHNFIWDSEIGGGGIKFIYRNKAPPPLPSDRSYQRSSVTEDSIK